MIVILKREDLLPEHRDKAVESLKLENAKLSPDVIEQAELIVFVENSTVKFLKHRQDFQSKESLEILMSYITSPPPTIVGRRPYGVKRHRRRKR